MQKSSKKKKKRKIFYGTFFLAVFQFPMIKKAEKVSGFVYFRKGRGKSEINYKKKKKIFFLLLAVFLTIFGR